MHSNFSHIELHLGERFFKYKQDVNGLRESVERFFSKIINQIEAGLPEVPDEESKENGDDFGFDGNNWTCPTCTNVNANTVEQCGICRTKKPVI